MAKVFVTAQGAAMKTNTWLEGQEISCSPQLAELFIEKGIATAEYKAKPEQPASAPKDTPKEQVQKPKNKKS